MIFFYTNQLTIYSAATPLKTVDILRMDLILNRFNFKGTINNTYSTN